jgi:hypothetical protein
MNVFAAAMETLAADPNIGVDASYRAGGTGAPVLLRVVCSAPDRLGDAFGTSVIQASDVLTVAIAMLPTVEADDTFMEVAEAVQAVARVAEHPAGLVHVARPLGHLQPPSLARITFRPVRVIGLSHRAGRGAAPRASPTAAVSRPPMRRPPLRRAGHPRNCRNRSRRRAARKALARAARF